MSIEELYNILLSDKPSEIIKEKESEIFKLIPELEECKGFNQNNDWHPYDVYEHILHVIDNVPSNIILRLTALFHDIGKPNSYKEDENKIGHFYGHWNESIKIFNSFCEKYNINKDLNKIISNLIYYHDINLGKLNDEQINDLCKIFTIKELKMLYELKRADLLAQNEKYHYILNDYEKQKSKLLEYYK